MDAIVRARFFRVEKLTARDASFLDCLRMLSEHAHATAYQDIGRGVRVRLERFELDGADPNNPSFAHGEFVRQQVDNIPPIAVEGEPLEGNENPLGHRCAFRYHPSSDVILLESRSNGVTPPRIHGLIRRRLDPHKGFFIAPVVTEDALERLRNGTLRRVKFRVASPADMASVEGDDTGMTQNLVNLTSNFEGLSIEVAVGFPQGKRGFSLNREAVEEAIEWAGGNRDHIERFEVQIAEEESPIDVFSEQLKAEEVLNLDNEDVDSNYNTRRDMLSQSFQGRLPLIERLYTT